VLNVAAAKMSDTPYALPRAGPALLLRQEQRPLAGLLQATALLTAGQSDLVAAAERGLAENPMLVRRAGSACPGCGRHQRAGRCAGCRGVAPARAAEPSHAPLESLEMLARCEARGGGVAAVPLVVAHLTDRGLLESDPADLAARHGLPVGHVEEAVRAVRAAGPPGIAQRTVRDLLRAQAEDLAARSLAPAWLPRLVADHLDAVATGAAEDAAASLGLDPEDVRAGFDLVRQRLRPWATPPPARDPGPPPLADVVVIRTQDGELDVEVPDSDWFGLQAAAIPARLRADAVAAGWLAEHRAAALAFLAQLDTRAAVLRRVARHTVLAQRAMFDHGPAHQADLSRSRVAAALGLHPSTVSRAVSGKTVRGPRGETFPLADLFGSGAAARRRIAELLGQRPHSDAELAAALAEQGLAVARRTVAKYRSQLGLAACATRRRGRS
jgi:RNA polymerase sigma-54 factor